MNDRNFSWDDIRLVKAVAETGGLHRAAEALGINHSTVFRRLQQIEQAVGTALFERHRGGYSPTAAGEEMAALGARMELDVTSFTRKLEEREPRPQGELRVTTSDSLLAHLMTPVFARFQQRYPEIRLDLVLGNQALNLSKRDADVAIRATDNPPDTLIGRRLGSVEWALYGSRADWAGRNPAEENLFHCRWVALADNLGHLNAAKYVRQHVSPERIVYKLNTVLGLAEAVEHGIGIGHMPCFIGDAKPGLIRLSGVTEGLSAGLWLLTHPDLKHVARVRAFMDFVADEVTRERARIEGRG